MFGKYQEIVAFLYFQAIYVLWYAGSAYLVYAVLTFNIPVCIFYAALIMIQTKIKKSSTYVNFCNKIIQARKGLSEVKLIYEEEIKP